MRSEARENALTALQEHEVVKVDGGGKVRTVCGNKNLDAVFRCVSSSRLVLQESHQDEAGAADVGVPQALR